MTMFGRYVARVLAPLALIAVVFALYTVVKDANAPKSDNGAQTSQPTATATSKSKKSKKAKKKMYTVKSGDTPSGIADKYGISLATLEKLNPKLDPQSLSPGERLKVSE